MKLELFVANVHVDNITHVMDKYVDGYSYAAERGVWKGEHEDMTHVTIYGPTPTADIVNAVVQLASANGEDSILVVVTNEYGEHASVVQWMKGHIERSAHARWERA